MKHGRKSTKRPRRMKLDAQQARAVATLFVGSHDDHIRDGFTLRGARCFRRQDGTWTAHLIYRRRNHPSPATVTWTVSGLGGIEALR